MAQPGPSVITDVEAFERGQLKLLLLRGPGFSDLVSAFLLAPEQSINLDQVEVLVDKLANALATRETLMPKVARKHARAAVQQMRDFRSMDVASTGASTTQRKLA